MRPIRLARRSAFVIALGGAVLVAGLVFWRVESGEVPYDGAPAWSADSRRIVFSVERGQQTDLFVMDADGSNRRQLTSTPAIEGAPAFSPDGARIAFESDRNGDSDIYVMDANGQNVQRLTQDPGTDSAPAWSPDGTHIAFLSDRDRKPRSDVYLMTADGTGVRRLTTTGQHWSPQFSPSGKALAVQNGRDIWIIDLAGGTPPRRLTNDPQTGMSPSWSPDGQELVFTSTRNTHLELFRMNADGSDQKLMVSMARASAMDPRWSPDGTRIAFVTVAHSEAKSGTSQPYAIYVFNTTSQRIARLSP